MLKITISTIVSTLSREPVCLFLTDLVTKWSMKDCLFPRFPRFEFDIAAVGNASVRELHRNLTLEIPARFRYSNSSTATPKPGRFGCRFREIP